MAGMKGRMTGLKHLISFDEATSRVRNGHWRTIGVIEVDVESSLDMIIAETVKSVVDLPPYHRSAVDGYAVRHRDISGADSDNPVSLRVIEDAEYEDGELLNSGQCFGINTGGKLPQGADSVIMAEYVTQSGDDILVEQSTRIWENVSRKGEDIASGSKIIEKGDSIRAWHIAALIATGRNRIKVYDRIKLGFMSTGDEIVRGSKSGIRNTTQPLMINYFRNGHVDTSDGGVYPDDYDIIRSAVLERVQRLDVLVVTGGSSIGKHDVSIMVLRELGKEIFRGVLIKPGRTISLYEISGKPVFSVSGLPVAALTSFEVFFDRYMIDFLGFNDTRQVIRAKLTERLINSGGMRSYVRVALSRNIDSLYATPMKTTGSGLLSTLLSSNGFTVVPESEEGLERGEDVWVTLVGGCY